MIAPHSADPPHSSRSILRVVERPLRQGLRYRFPPTLCTKMQQYLRLLHSVSFCEVPSQDANMLLQELLKHLDLLELSRETQNYIKLKLREFLSTIVKEINNPNGALAVFSVDACCCGTSSIHFEFQTQVVVLCLDT